MIVLIPLLMLENTQKIKYGQDKFQCSGRIC